MSLSTKKGTGRLQTWRWTVLVAVAGTKRPCGRHGSDLHPAADQTILRDGLPEVPATLNHPGVFFHPQSIRELGELRYSANSRHVTIHFLAYTTGFLSGALIC